MKRYLLVLLLLSFPMSCCMFPPESMGVDDGADTPPMSLSEDTVSDYEEWDPRFLGKEEERIIKEHIYSVSRKLFVGEDEL